MVRVVIAGNSCGGPIGVRMSPEYIRADRGYRDIRSLAGAQCILHDGGQTDPLDDAVFRCLRRKTRMGMHNAGALRQDFLDNQLYELLCIPHSVRSNDSRLAAGRHFFSIPDERLGKHLGAITLGHGV